MQPVVLWLLSVIPAVSAHVPHDTVTSMAVPADPADPWYLLAPKEGTYLLRSFDQGRTWEMFGADPIGDALEQIVLVEDGAGSALVARSASWLWWSRDGGETWARSALAGAALAVRSGDGTIYAAGRSGLWRYDEGWALCGLADAAVSLAVEGDRVLAATAEEAPWVSEDRCGGWARAEMPQQVVYGGAGGADSVEAAYPVLWVAGDRWFVGGGGRAVGDGGRGCGVAG